MMRKHWALCLLAATMLVGCVDGSDNDASQDPVINDPPVEEPEKADPCDLLTCTYGCANGKCVDVRSDVNNCGRPYHKCGNSVKFCKNGVCLAECNGDGAEICQGKCIDTRNNIDNCGGCDNKCGKNMMCSNSECTCTDGYLDWDGDARNGCETLYTNAECALGDTQECYTGAATTKNVGRCKAGITTCNNGHFSYKCEGQILPTMEIPNNGIDDDCNGEIDEFNDRDDDGDGWTVAQGDCCDSYLTCSALDPAKINPGAIDVSGNNIDDNCDGIIDNAATADSCSTTAFVPNTNAALTSSDAIKLAQAMDICNIASSQTDAGLLSAELLLADGSPLPTDGNKTICGSSTLISPAQQVAVTTKFGNLIEPISGSTMAVIASGKAQGHENSGRKDCSGTEVKVPSVFLNAHGGKLPTSTVCTTTREDTRANDSIMLRLKFRAPTNAAGIKFKFKFFSKEYPKYVCDKYNDFFLALLTSKHPDIPKDHNISFDTKGNPISVNNALFTECDAASCTGTGCSTCEDGSANVAAFVSDPKTAGATRWLQTSAPIVPGEEFTLDLIIFDAGEKAENTTNGFGHQQDSLVLIDNFEWTTQATTLETVVY